MIISNQERAVEVTEMNMHNIIDASHLIRKNPMQMPHERFVTILFKDKLELYNFIKIFEVEKTHMLHSIYVSIENAKGFFIPSIGNIKALVVQFPEEIREDLKAAEKHNEKMLGRFGGNISSMKESFNKDQCTHASIEEIQGGQIERCRLCGKTWGG